MLHRRIGERKQLDYGLLARLSEMQLGVEMRHDVVNQKERRRVVSQVNRGQHLPEFVVSRHISAVAKNKTDMGVASLTRWLAMLGGVALRTHLISMNRSSGDVDSTPQGKSGLDSSICRLLHKSRLRTPCSACERA